MSLCEPSGQGHATLGGCGLAGERVDRLGSGLDEAMLDMCEVQREADVHATLLRRGEGGRHAAGEERKCVYYGIRLIIEK